MAWDIKYSRERRTTPKATAKPGLRDLEWAAGFLEGEAAIRRIGCSQNIQVSQLNPDPLKRLQRLFGGSIALYPNARSSNNACGFIGQWNVCGTRARGVMLTLYGLLSAVRQKQVREAFRRRR